MTAHYFLLYKLRQKTPRPKVSFKTPVRWVNCAYTSSYTKKVWFKNHKFHCLCICVLVCVFLNLLNSLLHNHKNVCFKCFLLMCREKPVSRINGMVSTCYFFLIIMNLYVHVLRNYKWIDVNWYYVLLYFAAVNIISLIWFSLQPGGRNCMSVSIDDIDVTPTRQNRSKSCSTDGSKWISLYFISYVFYTKSPKEREKREERTFDTFDYNED